MVEATHIPILVAEVCRALAPGRCRLILDATFGRGGHTRALLAEMPADARLIALDRDPEAEQAARAIQDPRFLFLRGNFGAMQEVLARHDAGLIGRFDAILLDVGVSSPQLDCPERGFSFMRDGPLDMRMDPSAGLSAAQWLATAPEAEIGRVLNVYGEERFAARIARALARARERQPIERTLQLAQIVAAAVPAGRDRQHPATRTFQAIRIHLNRELEELQMALNQVLEMLAPGGRVAVISFHSLEDRLVKQWMRREAGLEARDPALRHVPLPSGQEAQARLRLIGKDLAPGEQEVAHNPRARSARLRVAEKSPC